MKIKNIITSLILGLTLSTGVAEARTAYQVYRMPSSGFIPSFGAIDLSQSAAVTGVLANANTTATSANTASAIVARDGSGNFSAGAITASSFIGPITGNASTATALAANPVDCNPGDFAIAIAANGDLTCATPAGSQAGIQFKDEGTNLGTSGTVNAIDCVGAGLTCSRSTDTITITAGGGGAGDFSSNTATSVDGEIVLFSGTGGKTGKRATGTGVAHITSGVLSASVVTIAEGGTGQTTKAAGFDALSPMTTAGDIIYGGASGTGTRLPPTTNNGYALKYNTGTNAPEWASDNGNYQATDWASYTPTFQGVGTPTNVEFFWRRVGDTIQVRGKLTSGSPTASEFRISLPTGLTSSSTTLIPTIQVAGPVLAFGSNFGSQHIPLIEPSVTYFTVGVQSSSSAGLTKATGSAIFGASGVTTSFYASTPINGWTSTGSDSEVYVTGNLANASTNTRVVYFSSGTVQKNQGTAITYAASSTLGDTYTINETGLYSIDVSSMGSGVVLGVSVNATGFLSTTINNNGFNYSQGHRGVNTAGAYFSRTLRLYAGDVLRVQTDGGAFGGGTISGMVNINKIGGGTDRPSSTVKVTTGNGSGSTNTKIRRYSTTAISTGSDITYADSATNGASFTINASGLYSISRTDKNSASAITFGVTKNTASGSTGIGSVAASELVCVTDAGSTTRGSCSIVVPLSAGDVIRPHDGTTTADDTTASGSYFSITRL